MALDSRWIDALFAKLGLRYGAAFARQWPEADLGAVKADWAEVLDGTSGEAIAYALRFLHPDRPPNALQFRDQCRRMPSNDAMPRLPAPAERADPERVKQLVAKAKQALANRHAMAGQRAGDRDAA